jgi:hypothetical protein
VLNGEYSLSPSDRHASSRLISLSVKAGKTAKSFDFESLIPQIHCVVAFSLFVPEEVELDP